MVTVGRPFALQKLHVHTPVLQLSFSEDRVDLCLLHSLVELANVPGIHRHRPTRCGGCVRDSLLSHLCFV